MSDWITRETGLFRGGEQVENFRRMSTIYPVRVIRRSSSPSPLPAGPAAPLPEAFEYAGRSLDTARFLAEMETTGLIVIRDGRVEFEDYWLGNDASTQAIGWSVSKSSSPPSSGSPLAKARSPRSRIPSRGTPRSLPAAPMKACG